MGVVGEEDGEASGGDGDPVRASTGAPIEAEVLGCVENAIELAGFEGDDAHCFGAGEDELDVGVSAVGFVAAVGFGFEGVFLKEGEEVARGRAGDVVAAEGGGKEVSGVAEAEGGSEERGERGVSGGVGKG